MVRKRWLRVGLITLAVLLVPALLWSQGRPAAPAAEQEGPPPALAARGSDLPPNDEAEIDGPEGSWPHTAGVPGEVSVAAGTPEPAAGASRVAAPATCPVTRPPQPPFVPPPPYDTLAPEAGSFWVGSRELWTWLPVGGAWHGLPEGHGGLTQKTFWWKPGYDPQVEPVPDLAVTGRRLDGPAPALEASLATNGFTDDMGNFMLAGIEVPQAGCWQITGRTAGQELSYVIWVAP